MCEYPPPTGVGFYWAPCVDALGVRALPCDSLPLPPGAVFVGNAKYGQVRPSWLSKCCGHDGVTLPGPFPRRS